MRKARLLTLLMVVGVLLAGCAGAPKKEAPGQTAAQPQGQTSQPQGQASQPQNQPAKTQPAPAKPQWPSPPEMKIDPKKQYTATIKTSLGDVKVELFAADAPLTVNNFVFLARENFYDGVVFHRIIKEFMIQTGDPTGTGAGGPGYRFKDELPVKRTYDPGIVAMANAGPNTNGSQFFICTGPQCAGLNNMPNYTQFGKVVSGMDVVQKLASVPVVANGREVSKPTQPPAILDVVIEER